MTRAGQPRPESSLPRFSGAPRDDGPSSTRLAIRVETPIAFGYVLTSDGGGGRLASRIVL